jgi:hypothetical protein
VANDLKVSDRERQPASSLFPIRNRRCRMYTPQRALVPSETNRLRI